MKKTKIVCSIGPASTDFEVFLKMIESGMNVARINFSHATEQDCEEALSLVDRANQLGHPIAVMYDTKGPDFRTGALQNGQIELKAGEKIQIVKEDILGDEKHISVNYKQEIDALQIHDIILIEDGMFKLEVIDKDEESLTCKILVGGVLGEHKGINIPGVELDEPFLSEQDIHDIRYACRHQGDFIALSFVSSKEDIESVRSLIDEEHSNMKIIAKIESVKAIENLDSIMEVSDGIMVARGDLGVEIPMNELPIIQKRIVRKCREQGKICIVATEMLSSMTRKIRPTRAEVSDVANAVLDGADAVMLSNETTIGMYPVEAVSIMALTCETTEKYIQVQPDQWPKDKTIMDTIAHSVVVAANNLDVKGILTSTLTGKTASHISALRPAAPILAFVTKEEYARSLALSFGVYPSVVPTFQSTDEMIANALELGKKILHLEPKDKVIVTGGFPQEKSTNFLKIEEI